MFHNYPGVLKIMNMNGNILRDILIIRISSGANNCVQRVFEKNVYFIMRFPPIFYSFFVH